MIRVEFAISYAELAQGIALALIAALAVVLAVLVRRRRRRERAASLMRGISYDFFPMGDHSAIEEIRSEVDASHRRSLAREAEEDWQRDGRVLLEKRKGA